MNESQAMDAPLRVTVKAGEEVTLDCEAQGSPTPLVTWTKDGHPLLPVTNRYPVPECGACKRLKGCKGWKTLVSRWSWPEQVM